MTHKQVKAAWNREPDVENPGFIFGIGEVVFCCYRSNKDGNDIIVVLKNNRVVGWSSNLLNYVFPKYIFIPLRF